MSQPPWPKKSREKAASAHIESGRKSHINSSKGVALSEMAHLSKKHAAKREVAKELPRYVRVNTLKTSFSEAKKQLREEGHLFRPVKRQRNSQSWRRVKPDKKKGSRNFTLDEHIKGLLVFRFLGSVSVLHRRIRRILTCAFCLCRTNPTTRISHGAS